jgi:hypothetical protein
MGQNSSSICWHTAVVMEQEKCVDANEGAPSLPRQYYHGADTLDTHFTHGNWKTIRRTLEVHTGHRDTKNRTNRRTNCPNKKQRCTHVRMTMRKHPDLRSIRGGTRPLPHLAAPAPPSPSWSSPTRAAWHAYASRAHFVVAAELPARVRRLAAAPQGAGGLDAVHVWRQAAARLARMEMSPSGIEIVADGVSESTEHGMPPSLSLRASALPPLEARLGG